MMDFADGIGSVMGMCLAGGGFVFSELLLIFVIFKKVLNAELRDACMVSAIVIFLQLLLTPYPVEAFCSSFQEGYVFSYNEAMLMMALLVLGYDTKLEGAKEKVFAAQLLILSALTAGGAYAVAISMLLFYAVVMILYWYRRSLMRFTAIAGFLLYIAIFVWNISSISWNTDFAMAGVTGISAIKVVWRSLKTAIPYGIQCMSLACMLGAALMVPLLIKVVEKKKGPYPLPALVSTVSFGFFVTLFFPSLYTSGLVGGNQAINVYRWSFYLWLYGNELYWTGWYMRRYREGEA